MVDAHNILVVKREGTIPFCILIVRQQDNTETYLRRWIFECVVWIYLPENGQGFGGCSGESFRLHKWSVLWFDPLTQHCSHILHHVICYVESFPQFTASSDHTWEQTREQPREELEPPLPPPLPPPPPPPPPSSATTTGRTERRAKKSRWDNSQNMSFSFFG